MMSDPRARLLCSLLSMSQDNETIDIFSLSEAAGLTLYQALKHLNILAQANLVDARRLRLTFNGLAVAAALSKGEVGEKVSDSVREEPEPAAWRLADSAA